MSNVFLIGNGESRKGFDLNTLKPHGKVYGCNAIYRDFTPDVLVAVDHGIMHEIYRGGYGYTNECWFRDWTRIPAHMYEHLKDGMLLKVDLDNMEKWNCINKNNRTDEMEFVMHGSNLSGEVHILDRGLNTKTKKNINRNELTINWVRDDDKVHNINDIMPNNIDIGWAAGPMSGYIAVKQNNPQNVYLLGHDLKSDTGLVNNIYKGTLNYVIPEHTYTPAENWILQWKILFEQNPTINFYKVNESNTGGKTTNKPLDAWKSVSNVTYIDYTQLKDKLK